MMFFGKQRGMDLVKKLAVLNGADNPKSTVDALYAVLTILDSKATGLLTVDTLLIAILCALLAIPHPEMATQFHVTESYDLVLIAQLGFSTLSAFLCLLMVRVTWRFYFWVKADLTAATLAKDLEAEIMHLANVIDDRTHYFWLAWKMTILAFILTLAWWSPLVALAAAAGIFFWIHSRG